MILPSARRAALEVRRDVDRPNIVKGFSVIRHFVHWLRLVRTSSRITAKLFSSHGVGPAWKRLPDSMIFPNSQRLRKFSSCIALSSRGRLPSSLGRTPPSSNGLFLAVFHSPLRAMKPSTANSFRNLLNSSLVVLLFRPSIFHPLAPRAGALSSSRIAIRFN